MSDAIKVTVGAGRLGADEWQTVQKTEEGKGWRHWSEVSQRNSYTGKVGMVDGKTGMIRST